MELCACVLSHVQLFATPWTVACRLLCQWDFQSKDTEVGCHFLLQGTFPIRGLNLCLLCLLHWQVDSLPLAPPGKPHISISGAQQPAEGEEPMWSELTLRRRLNLRTPCQLFPEAFTVSSASNSLLSSVLQYVGGRLVSLLNRRMT